MILGKGKQGMTSVGDVVMYYVLSSWISNFPLTGRGIIIPGTTSHLQRVNESG